MTELGFIGRCGAATMFVCQAATTEALPANGYDPETKMLTALADGALTLDGVTPLLVGVPVLVNHEADQTKNGIYYPLQAGAVDARWVLRRALSFNSTKAIRAGCVAMVTDGAENMSKMYALAPSRARVIDVDPIVFTVHGDYITFAELAATLATADAPLDFNGQKATNLGTPTPGSAEAATAAYAEAVATAAAAGVALTMPTLRLLGRVDPGDGPPAPIALTSTLDFIGGTANLGVANGVLLNQHVHVSAAIAFTKLATIATDKLLGRDTAGTGTLEAIGLTGGLEMDGSGNVRIATAGVQRSQQQSVVASRLLGRGSAGGTGAPEELSLANRFSLSGVVLDLASGGVANSYLAIMAQNTIKGRVSSGSGAPEDLTATQALSVLGVNKGTGQYYCLLTRTTNQSFTAASGFEVMLWTDELADPNAMHSTVSSTGRVQILAAGMYRVTVEFFATQAGTIRLRRDGTTQISDDYSYSANTIVSITVERSLPVCYIEWLFDINTNGTSSGPSCIMAVQSTYIP